MEKETIKSRLIPAMNAYKYCEDGQEKIALAANYLMLLRREFLSLHIDSESDQADDFLLAINAMQEAHIHLKRAAR